MFKDITYIHEHITIDLSKEKMDLDCKLDLFNETKKELLQLKKLGVSNIVDLTNIGMGRDPHFIEKMEKETGLNIYMSTGFYKEPFLPENINKLSENEIANIMINDIIYGISNSNKKASFIGEIGSGFNSITSLEKKVFIGAAIAQKATGKYISTHTSLGKLAHEQLDIFEEYKVPFNKIILGHTALSNNLEYIESLLKRGVYIAFDTIGKINYLSDETRAFFIKSLCDKGWSHKLLLSVDLTRKSHLKVNGGIGYSYLLESFIPLLEKKGVSKNHIINMLIKNPKTILEIN